MWQSTINAIVDAAINLGEQHLLENDQAYFDRKVRAICVRLHENPTLIEIRDYLIKMIRLEKARIELGHHTANLNRLTAALQLSSAVHKKLAAEARERGAH